MGKLKSVIGGTLLGAGGMYVGLQYHVLMAPEGPLLVPRSPHHSLKEAYADIQGWDAGTWAAHPQIALAVKKHGRADLIGEEEKPDLLDSLRSTPMPPGEQVSTSNRGWEPVSSPDAPAPAAKGKVAETDNAPEQAAPPRRSFLPLAELFGFKSSTAPTDEAGSDETETAKITPVHPARTNAPPVVELLPAPDEADMAQPVPLPRRPRTEWRQTDTDVAKPRQTATGRPDWEPLTSLPPDWEKS